MLTFWYVIKDGLTCGEDRMACQVEGSVACSLQEHAGVFLYIASNWIGILTDQMVLGYPKAQLGWVS